MHFDETGAATGDCLLAMASREDALQSVQRLRNAPLKDRRIQMYVVPF